MGLDSYLLNEKKDEIAFWRKANQIHDWFVNNVQRGKDNQKSYKVKLKHLESLLLTCVIVKSSCILEDSKMNDEIEIQNEGNENVANDELYNLRLIVNPDLAKELLPTCPGFFFGETTYDELYLKQINDTIDILIPIIIEYSKWENLGKTIYYWSSW